jgi:hypothetical protein
VCVCVQVPLMMTVYVLLAFKKFVLLDAPSKRKPSAWFDVPSDYPVRRLCASASPRSPFIARPPQLRAIAQRAEPARTDRTGYQTFAVVAYPVQRLPRQLFALQDCRLTALAA